MKKLFFIFISIITLVILFAFVQLLPSDVLPDLSQSKEYYGVEDVSRNYSEEAKEYNSVDDSSQIETTSYVDTRKVIKSGYISIETEKFDNAYDSILNKSTQIGGYVQTSRFSKNDVYIDNIRNFEKSGPKIKALRNGYIEVRIPQESFIDFLSYLKNLGDITSSNTNTQDITDSYDITKSRLESLNVQESRILEIMKEAKNVSDLIQLENELNRIRTEIQIASNQLNGWNKQISLSTVVINLQEIKSSDESIQIKETNIWGSSKKGFIKTTNKLIELVQYLIIFIVSSIPVLIIIAIIIIVTISLVKSKNKKRE